jgi:S-adenosylmethionine:tRNA ribosyltransferase-isomerase
MRTEEFHFELPPNLIAQQPAKRRDESRLLVFHRRDAHIEHRQFRDVLDYFHSGDVLVLNNSKVIRARLRGVNEKTGGAFEMLLLEENATNDWWAMMKPGKRARVGTRIEIRPLRPRMPDPIPQITAIVIDTNAEGHRRLRFEGTENILRSLDSFGEIPLPPYTSW